MKPNDIRLAHRRLQLAWEHLENEWAIQHPADPTPILSQVWRSPAMQAAYYAQGRESLAETNRLRKLAGLGAIGAAEGKKIITWARAGQSYHEHTPARAIDLAFVKPGTRSLDWSERLFHQAAKIILTYDPSITWGGDWNRNGRTNDERKPDLPHFQV